MGKHEKPAVAWVIERSYRGSDNYDTSDPLLDEGVFLSKYAADFRARELNKNLMDFNRKHNQKNRDNTQYYASEVDLHE